MKFATGGRSGLAWGSGLAALLGVPALLGVAALLSLALSGCDKPAAPSIELEVGSERFRFVPRTAFAEYWELPGAPDQLRITLASYSASCDGYRGPEKGEALVTLTLRVPVGKNIAPGEFRWNGLEETPGRLEEQGVVPFVRLAHEGRALAAGGSLRLTHFDKGPHGLVEAEFAFSAPASAEGSNEPTRSSSGLRGGLSVRMCRVLLDPSRSGLEPRVLGP